MEAAPAAPEPTEKRPAPFSPEVLARELNPAQLEAVLRPPGPMVVVAGAGSGKTRVITYRLARLVATGADPRRIARRHLHQQGGGRAARAGRQAALGADEGRQPRPLGRHLPRHLGAHPAPVGRGGRAAQGLRHLRRRRSEAGARAGAHRPQGPRADVPGAAGALGASTAPRTTARRPTRSTRTTTSTT